jgi:hypothetical protein
VSLSLSLDTVWKLIWDLFLHHTAAQVVWRSGKQLYFWDDEDDEDDN